MIIYGFFFIISLVIYLMKLDQPECYRCEFLFLFLDIVQNYFYYRVGIFILVYH